MARKVNPVGWNIFPLFPNRTPKKTDMPLSGKVVPPANKPHTELPVSPRAGMVSKPRHTGRNVAVTAALALVTLAVVKGIHDYKINQKSENPKEIVKK